MLMEADLNTFLYDGSGTPNELEACFPAGHRMSSVCFNGPSVQGWVIIFDAF